MSDSQTDATVTVSVRMPTALAETLAVRAEGNERSRSREIVSILKAATTGTIYTHDIRDANDRSVAVEPLVANPLRTDTADVQFKRHAVNKPAHDFQPQTKNARCGECGRLRHEH